jgi:hypothetical protein
MVAAPSTHALAPAEAIVTVFVVVFNTPEFETVSETG